MNEHNIIFFSGGLDSTYLMYKNLLDGNHVYPVYVTLLNNEEKTIKEKQAMDNIWRILKDLFPDKLSSIKFLSEARLCEHTNDVYPRQSIVFLTHCAMCYHLDIKYDSVQLGLCRGDHGLSELDELRNLWKALNDFSSIELPELRFPLKKKLKIEEWESLPKSIKEAIWICETPENCLPCKSCGSCKRAEAEYGYISNYKFPIDINAYVKVTMQMSKPVTSIPLDIKINNEDSI